MSLHSGAVWCYTTRAGRGRSLVQLILSTQSGSNTHARLSREVFLSSSADPKVCAGNGGTEEPARSSTDTPGRPVKSGRSLPSRQRCCSAETVLWLQVGCLLRHGLGHGRAFKELLAAEKCSISVLPGRNAFGRLWQFELDFSGVIVGLSTSAVCRYSVCFGFVSVSGVWCLSMTTTVEGVKQ